MSKFTGHNQGLKGLEGLADVTKDILEGKTHIYELVAEFNAEEVADFIAKAEAAIEEGKDTITINGKVFPTSMLDQVKRHCESSAAAATDEYEKEELSDGMDPVGKEDDDIDNDGDVDDSDEYLKKKRDAISKAIEKEEKEVEEELELEEKASEEENDDPSGVYKDNEEIAPETKADVEGEDDIEKTDGEEEEKKEVKVKKVKKESKVDLALVGKLISEGIDLDEGKMKELHALVSAGVKDPKKIAKELGLKPSKDTTDAISALIKGMK